MEATGAIVATSLSPGSMPIPSWGAGWSWGDVVGLCTMKKILRAVQKPDKITDFS